MHDVARAAGVSHQTVSARPQLPPQRPAGPGRKDTSSWRLPSLATAATPRHVALRDPPLGRDRCAHAEDDLYGPTSTMIAVEVAAREAGYFVSLASVADSSAAALDAAVEHFKDQAVEAVVLIAPEREWLTTARVVANDLPVVTMSADYRRPSRGSFRWRWTAPRRCPPRHEALARSRAPGHRLHRRPSRLARSCDAVAFVARRDEERWPRHLARAARRLEFGDRVCGRPPDRRRRSADGGLLGERPDGAGAALRPRRGGRRCPRRRVGGRVRRPARCRVLPAGPDDCAPGLRHSYAARCVAVLERILAGDAASSVSISGELVIRESTAPPPT